MMIVYFIIAVAFLIAYILIERQIIFVRKQNIDIENLPKEFENFKILQISDVHHRTFGENQSRIIKRAKLLSPDIIVITGDLISRDMRDFSAVAAFCRELTDISPVFFSMGNHELDLPEKVKHTYIAALKSSGVNLLLNSVFTLQRADESLNIAGLLLETNVYRDEKFSYKKLSAYSSEKIENCIGVHDKCTVLLAHNPLIFDSYASWNAELILSGHVHGGVIRLPFIGGVLSPERKFFPKYSRGLYSMGKSKMYVSAGLGKLRLFNPPQIDIISLHKNL